MLLFLVVLGIASEVITLLFPKKITQMFFQTQAGGKNEDVFKESDTPASPRHSKEGEMPRPLVNIIMILSVAYIALIVALIFSSQTLYLMYGGCLLLTSLIPLFQKKMLYRYPQVLMLISGINLIFLLDICRRQIETL